MSHGVAPLPDAPGWAWAALFGAAAVAIAFDLRAHRGGKGGLSLAQALVRTGVWIGLALSFFGVLWSFVSPEAAQQYVSGYLVELSLSADNVFLFVLVFEKLKVDEARQHRVLFWGVLGAVTIRTAFILGGMALLHRLDWLLYAFGAFLLLTGVRLVKGAASRHEKDPSQSGSVKTLGRWLHVDMTEPPVRFFVRRDGRLHPTPLLLALVAVEVADFVFALDSLPAVLGVTSTAFLAVASNLLAILGLRSLYFLIGGAMKRMRFLNLSIAAILTFIGLKMVTAPWYEVSTVASLAVIGSLLLAGIAVSLVKPQGR